jgi:transcription initiation factor TFIIF subunit alpha
MGSADLVLKTACEGCGNTSDLYGTGCKHTTLCSDCGKSMARSRARCLVCSAPITRLIRVRIRSLASLFLAAGMLGVVEKRLSVSGGA